MSLYLSGSADLDGMFSRRCGQFERTSESLSLLAEFTPWGASSGKLGQDETSYPLQSGSDSQYGAMEEEPKESNANTVAGRPEHWEQRLPLGKQFPSKLYRMLEDKTVEPYVRWLKTEHGDAFLIPDTGAFMANVMPKHFKEMTQLNNYGFEKRNRGQGKALYAHSGNKFCQGRPDLLREVLRRPSWQTNVCTGQASGREQSTHISSAPDSTTPESESRADHLEHENKELKMKILELKSEFEEWQSTTEERQSATEERLQATENQLQITERRLFEMEKQLLELSRKRERELIGDAALNSVVDLGRAQSMGNIDVLYHGLNIPATADGRFSTYCDNSLLSASFESSLPTGIAYDPVNPSFTSAFLGP
ncbi:hypothetical protein FS837_001838 [Tulasnella sp. UAMH 9824]|nr:hypothetical protein FS837_001838 [Tulasnella sp. UAMH 9824]